MRLQRLQLPFELADPIQMGGDPGGKVLLLVVRALAFGVEFSVEPLNPIVALAQTHRQRLKVAIALVAHLLALVVEAAERFLRLKQLFFELGVFFPRLAHAHVDLGTQKADGALTFRQALGEFTQRVFAQADLAVECRRELPALPCSLVNPRVALALHRLKALADGFEVFKMALNLCLAHGQQLIQRPLALARLVGRLLRRRTQRLGIPRRLFELRVARVDVVLAVLQLLLQKVELLLFARDDLDQILLLRELLQDQLVNRGPVEFLALEVGLLRLCEALHHVFNLALARLDLDLLFVEPVVEGDLLAIARGPNLAEAGDLTLALAQFLAQDLELALGRRQILAAERRLLVRRCVSQKLGLALGDRGKGARKEGAIVLGDGAAPLALGHGRRLQRRRHPWGGTGLVEPVQRAAHIVASRVLLELIQGGDHLFDDRDKRRRLEGHLQVAMGGVGAVAVRVERLFVGLGDEEDRQCRVALLPDACERKARLLRQLGAQDDHARVAVFDLLLGIAHIVGERGLKAGFVQSCGQGESELLIVIDNQDSTLIHGVGTHSVCALAAKGEGRRGPTEKGVCRSWGKGRRILGPRPGGSEKMTGPPLISSEAPCEAEKSVHLSAGRAQWCAKARALGHPSSKDVVRKGVQWWRGTGENSTAAGGPSSPRSTANGA